MVFDIFCSGIVRIAARAARLLPAIILLSAGTGAAAPTSPQPVTLDEPDAGRVILTVEAGARTLSLTLRQIEALGTYRVQTTTFWPADNGVYEGVLLADLLRHAGLSGVASVRLVSLDGYSQAIPHEDWARWPLMIATRRAGKPIRRREKGPLRLIYPRDTDDLLKDHAYRLRWVWMIQKIVVPAAGSGK